MIDEGRRVAAAGPGIRRSIAASPDTDIAISIDGPPGVVELQTRTSLVFLGARPLLSAE